MNLDRLHQTPWQMEYYSQLSFSLPPLSPLETVIKPHPFNYWLCVASRPQLYYCCCCCCCCVAVKPAVAEINRETSGEETEGESDAELKHNPLRTTLHQAANNPTSEYSTESDAHVYQGSVISQIISREFVACFSKEVLCKRQLMREHQTRTRCTLPAHVSIAHSCTVLVAREAPRERLASQLVHSFHK